MKQIKFWLKVFSTLVQLFIAILLVILIAVMLVYGQPKARTVKLSNGSKVCTATVIKTGYALTAAHCLSSKGVVKIGDKEAEILKQDKKADLALLKVETAKFRMVKIVEPKQKDRVYVYGYPFDSPNTFYSEGYVSVRNYDHNYCDVILMAGGSGSALWKGNRLAGVMVSTMRLSGGMISMAVPAETVRNFLADTEVLK